MDWSFLWLEESEIKAKLEKRIKKSNKLNLKKIWKTNKKREAIN